MNIKIWYEAKQLQLKRKVKQAISLFVCHKPGQVTKTAGARLIFTSKAIFLYEVSKRNRIETEGENNNLAPIVSLINLRIFVGFLPQ